MEREIYRIIIERAAWQVIDAITAAEFSKSPKGLYGNGPISNKIQKIYNRGVLAMDEEIVRLAYEILGNT